MTIAKQEGARILIVDDQADNVTLLERILEPTYANVLGTTEPGRALDLIREFGPDILLLDLHMPGTGGFAILEQLRGPESELNFLPIVVLTADATTEARNRALHLGANDYLTKPLDRQEVLLRVRNILHTRMLQVELAEQNRWLEHRVHERTKELDEANADSLQRLAVAAEFRDDDTGKHTMRVGELAAGIARTLGWDQWQVDMVRSSAGLHDVGKIAIPDAVLLKPAKLTAEEFETMKTHTTVGARILGGSRSNLLQMAQTIALTHHERWDGSGYPNGLSDERIPLVGRIVAVADVYDSLTHERVYKRAWSQEEALAEITAQSGMHFDPAAVGAFLEALAISNAA